MALQFSQQSKLETSSSNLDSTSNQSPNHHFYLQNISNLPSLHALATPAIRELFIKWSLDAVSSLKIFCSLLISYSIKPIFLVKHITASQTCSSVSLSFHCLLPQKFSDFSQKALLSFCPLTSYILLKHIQTLLPPGIFLNFTDGVNDHPALSTHILSQNFSYHPLIFQILVQLKVPQV